MTEDIYWQKEQTAKNERLKFFSNNVMLEETKRVSEHECLFDQRTSKINSRLALHPKPETMGKHRVRKCRKLHTEPPHLQYLNGEAVTSSLTISKWRSSNNIQWRTSSV